MISYAWYLFLFVYHSLSRQTVITHNIFLLIFRKSYNNDDKNFFPFWYNNNNKTISIVYENFGFLLIFRLHETDTKGRNISTFLFLFYLSFCMMTFVCECLFIFYFFFFFVIFWFEFILYVLVNNTGQKFLKIIYEFI